MADAKPMRRDPEVRGSRPEAAGPAQRAGRTRTRHAGGSLRQPPRPRPRDHAESQKRVRRVLLALGPIVAARRGRLHVSVRRAYVSTDNAYVRADKLHVATDVSGTVAEVAVRENERVEKGAAAVPARRRALSASRSPAPRRSSATVRNEIATLQATYRQKPSRRSSRRKTDVAFYAGAVRAASSDLQKRGVATQAAFDQAQHDLDAARERVSGGAAPGRGDPRPTRRRRRRRRSRPSALPRRPRRRSTRRERDCDHTMVRAPDAGHRRQCR